MGNKQSNELPCFDAQSNEHLNMIVKINTELKKCLEDNKLTEITLYPVYDQNGIILEFLTQF